MRDTAALLPAAFLDPVLRRRLRRTAWLVRGLLAMGLLVMAFVELPAWAWGPPDTLRDGLADLSGLAVEKLRMEPAALVRAALLSLLPLGLITVGLARLWQLFGEYAQGRVFTRPALRGLRGFARSLLGLALLLPLYRMGMSVALTWDFAPGQRELVVVLSGTDYLRVVLGTIFVVIASVMAEAARVAEDNAGFV